MKMYLKIFCLYILCFGGFLMASECPQKGEIHSNSPVVYFGEVINVTCTVNGDASLQVLSESLLYFKASKLKVGSSDRTLKGKPLDNPPNIGITISDVVNQTASKENKYMHYMCLYDQCLIDQIFLEIEYRPQLPDSGKCKVYNWERMECKWDLHVEYRQQDLMTFISLMYSVTTESWSLCPDLSVTGRTLTCVIEDKKNSPMFIGHYYFVLTVNNTKTLHSANISSEFHTNSIVKPAKVHSVSAEANRSSIHLKWSVEMKFQPQLFRIRYAINPNFHQNPVWKEVNTTGRDVVLKDLLPYRNYTIQINAIPLVNNKSTGFWSDTTVVSNTTLQDVPSDVPNIDPGFYSCIDANCTRVTLYWQQISDNSSNGIIMKYRITIESNGTQSQPLYIEDPSLTEYIVPVNNKYNTRIKLNVATEVGFSTKSDSSLNVAPLHYGPPYAENIIVEALEFKVVNISWATPRIPENIKAYSITNYSIMWCIGDQSGCKGEIEYEIVRFMKGKKTYWKKLDMAESFEKYAFGISVDAFKRTGRFISSGIKWNQCSYKVDAVPRDPVKVNLVLEDDQKSNNETMLFKWNTYSCQTHRVGPIQNFTIIVCSIDGKENCEGTPQEVVLRGNQTEYRVMDLIGGKYYKIRVSAGFKGGNSPPGQYTFKSSAANSIPNPSDKGAEGGVSLGAIAGGVVAVIAVAVIIIIAWKISGAVDLIKYTKAVEAHGSLALFKNT
ncbi:protogenin-like isoform X2 [Ostrea edulis]|uniref:protogenin-like isoform X2 n=1 Tax=Ostrea edulis TaxID=37623 RepID=UPI0024AF4E62|nr:protogenin-like isoform X2 [Ostrea edulis]